MRLLNWSILIFLVNEKTAESDIYAVEGATIGSIFVFVQIKIWVI